MWITSGADLMKGYEEDRKDNKGAIIKTQVPVRGLSSQKEISGSEFIILNPATCCIGSILSE